MREGKIVIMSEIKEEKEREEDKRNRVKETDRPIIRQRKQSIGVCERERESVTKI